VTTASNRGSFLARKGVFWTVAGLILVLFVITDLPWQLDDYDQAKQAFTSFEMIEQGHWLYQHTPNEKIATKPPLVGWVSAASYMVLRSWDLAWRFPSIAAAVLLLILLTRAATQAYGAEAALLAMAAFGLNLLSPRLATLVRTDMPLGLIVFLLGLQIWRKVRAAEPWRIRDQMITLALLTAAMLIKGPIVYAFLLPGIVAFQWSRRGSMGRVNAWCGWWPWVASLLVFGLWVWAGISWVPQFYEQVVQREFFGRFGETVHRPQPFYFYFPHLLHKFAPWSLLMIGLVFASRTSRKSSLRERWRQLSPDVMWLVCWSLGGLLIMSVIPSKRVDRIFPIVPPLCLLLAAQFSARTKTYALAPRIRRWSLIALLVACLFTGGYAAQKIFFGYRADEGALMRFGKTVRRAATANGWRYQVIGGKEEGLLLYLRRNRFISVDEAKVRWNEKRVDAIVAPAENVPDLLRDLPGAAESGLEATITVNDRPRRYVLLKRS
jgi:4-amino-4-deoxy-L-arabinose transferase-like glycosyltransferase